MLIFIPVQIAELIAIQEISGRVAAPAQGHKLAMQMDNGAPARADAHQMAPRKLAQMVLLRFVKMANGGSVAAVVRSQIKQILTTNVIMVLML